MGNISYKGIGTIFKDKKKRDANYYLQYSIKKPQLDKDGKFKVDSNGDVITKSVRYKKSLKTNQYPEAVLRAQEISSEITSVRDAIDLVDKLGDAKGLSKNQKSQIKAQIERESKNTIKITDAWSRFVSLNNNGKVVIVDYKRFWGKFETWVLKELDNSISMHQITRVNAKTFAQYLDNQKSIGPSTYNKHIQFYRLFFKSLFDEAGLTYNPFENIPTKKTEASEKRELTKSELDKVYDAVDKCLADELTYINKSSEEHIIYRNRCLDLSESTNKINDIKKYVTDKWEEIRLLFRLGVYTGLRLKDACLIKWSDIDLNKRKISVKTSKKNKWVQLPIIPQLEACLRLLIDNQTQPEFVLPIISAMYKKDRSNPQKLCKKVFEKSGIETSVKIEKDRRAQSKVGFHSLRHTFVSECAKAGVPLTTVQALVGHGSPAVTRLYTHIDIDTAREGLQRAYSIEDKSSLKEDWLENIKSMVDDLNPENCLTMKKEILSILEAQK